MNCCERLLQHETITVLSNKLNFVLSFLSVCNTSEKLHGEHYIVDSSSQKPQAINLTESQGDPVQPTHHQLSSSSVTVNAQANRACIV